MWEEKIIIVLIHLIAEHKARYIEAFNEYKLSLLF